MSNAIEYTQAELRRAGHVCLSARLHEHPDGLLQLSPQYAITAEQAIKTGILATLLRIADNQAEMRNTLQAIAKYLSRLAGIQNMATLVEEL